MFMKMLIFPSFDRLLQNTVDKLVQRANASLVVGSSSWKEQFIEAITVNPSGILKNQLKNVTHFDCIAAGMKSKEILLFI